MFVPMFHKIDQWFTETSQEVYLWFYDWTGVYVASLQAILIIVSFFLSGLVWWSMIVLGLNLFILIRPYLLQDREQYKLFNAIALAMRDNYVRLFFQYLSLGMSIDWFVLSLIIHDKFFTFLQDSIAMLCLFVFFVLETICIREREPKEWFRKIQWAPTT